MKNPQTLRTFNGMDEFDASLGVHQNNLLASAPNRFVHQVRKEVVKILLFSELEDGVYMGKEAVIPSLLKKQGIVDSLEPIKRELCWIKPRGHESPFAWVFTYPYVDGGTCQRFAQSDFKWTAHSFLGIAKLILEPLVVLHEELEMVHGDLKPEIF